jgi:hypothetical protein
MGDTDPSMDIGAFLKKQSEIVCRIDSKYLDRESAHVVVIGRKFLSAACDDQKPILVSKLLERDEIKNDFESIGEIFLALKNRFDMACLLFSHLRKHGALKHDHLKRMFELCVRYLSCIKYQSIEDSEIRSAKYLKCFTIIQDCTIEYKEILFEKLDEIPIVFYFFNSIEDIGDRKDECSEFLSLQILEMLKCFQDAGFDPTIISYQGLEFIQHLIRNSTPLCLSGIEYLAIEKNISIQKLDFNFHSNRWRVEDFEKLRQIKRMQNEYQSGSFKRPRIEV